MYVKARGNMPDLFRGLVELGCMSEGGICGTDDGLWAAVSSLADILACRNITSVPADKGGSLECRLFFDDWYLYAVPCGTSFTYSLFKMREQEHDAKLGLNADGDIPGVTICFIAMEEELLVRCLAEPSEENRRLLGREINRVVAAAGQTHSRVLKNYFVRTEAQGAYLIAKLYTDYIASLAENGVLPVPERYAEEFGKKGKSGRVAGFIEENNRAADTSVCDHEKIYIKDPASPARAERLAILATHTGNVSFCSFAAEVQFHALFLTKWANVRLPVVGKSPYASAIRADMSIGDAELVGPTPYYRLNSRLVRRQRSCHESEIKLLG